MIRIALTGPECTGKSTLTVQLAKHYNAPYFSEYARDYIGSLDREYTYEDVVHIAEVQIRQAKQEVPAGARIAFFDTYLIITKVWFNVVFGKYPGWIDEELKSGTIDLYLLCNTEIPWIADNVRENGGEMREKLYSVYEKELQDMGCRYVVVTGTDSVRLIHAIEAIERFFPDICQ
jgi:NadR type nicotinamide-nucleotide adenylyltransferase